MKAFALTTADKPAALIDLPDPVIADDGALVRARAASVNGFDVFQAGGALIAMMPHELPTVIGRDVAGIVEAVGPARIDVSVGDEVFGFVTSAPPLHEGTFAELVAGGPSRFILARKPAGLSWEVAAAIPLAGSTALDSVDAVHPGPGDTVLIVGATGGVGSIAVQLVAQRGATVIATAKAGDEEAFVRSLGATETIDYSTENVAEAVRARFPGGIAALIDTIDRGDAFGPVAALVRDGGAVSTTLGAADVEGLAARRVTATNIMGAPTPEKLTSLADQVAAGSLQIRIQRTFPLAEADAALATFMAGTLGKIVLTIA
jgi:NADPH:quinone reductase-like Zn-dependent oxidoreductase